MPIGGPGLEDICGVWEQDALVVGFGLLDDLEELSRDLRCGGDTPVGGASKDQKHVLAFHNAFISLFVGVAATGLHWREDAFVISLSTAVEDSDDEAVVFLAHCTESTLQVVERDLFGTVRHDNLALIVLHHSVSTVVHDCQCLLALVAILADLLLKAIEGLFGCREV